jgi:hypothetical protein
VRELKRNLVFRRIDGNDEANRLDLEIAAATRAAAPDGSGQEPRAGVRIGLAIRSEELPGYNDPRKGSVLGFQ